MVGRREVINPLDVVPVTRNCLKCGLDFLSTGFRICPTCTESNKNESKKKRGKIQIKKGVVKDE